MKNKLSKTIPKTELIWGVDVARIFGVSKSEFHKRLRSGVFKNMSDRQIDRNI